VISLGRDTVSWFFERLVILILGGQSMQIDLHWLCFHILDFNVTVLYLIYKSIIFYGKRRSALMPQLKTLYVVVGDRVTMSSITPLVLLGGLLFY